MYDQYRFHRRVQPSKPGLEVHELIGWGMCIVAVGYLFAAALLGLLAS
jgi:hypothetical protein